MKVYVVGSLKHPRPREVAEALREAGHEVFDDWHASGPDADMHWQSYEQERGRNYVEALDGPFARNGFRFDRDNLDKSEVIVAVTKPFKLPGISSVAELGYARSMGKFAFVLLDGEPERWDLMLPLVVDKFFYTLEHLLTDLKQ